MKVLIIVNELLYTCGVSNHVYNLLYGMKEKEGIEIILLCGGGNAIAKYRDLGYKVIVEEEIRHEGRSILRYFKGVMKLYKIIKNNQIEIVHSHHHYAANMVHKIKYFTGVRTILTNHGLLPEVGLLNHFSADYIIALNEHIIKYISDKKIKKGENVFLIRSGVIINPHDRVFLNANDKIRIITASRLVPEKGNDIYIKAVAELDERYRDKTFFYLAGEGVEEEKLMLLNKKLNSGIIFLGRVENLSEKLFHYDIVVVPSISKSEGFPMIMIEAGMAKCIIISSNFNGVEYILMDNIDGYIFEQSNYIQLAEKIKYAIDNFSRSKELAQNYFTKVSTLYDITKMVNDTVKLYKKVL